MADDEDVFVLGALAQQALELGERGGGGERVGDEDLGLVAGLGADELRGLQAAFEGAGDDEVEAELHRVEDLREVQAVVLAFLVERALEVEQRIDAAGSGAGVAEDEEIHLRPCRSVSVVVSVARGVVVDAGVGLGERRRGGFGVRQRVFGEVRRRDGLSGMVVRCSRFAKSIVDTGASRVRCRGCRRGVGGGRCGGSRRR